MVEAFLQPIYDDNGGIGHALLRELLQGFEDEPFELAFEWTVKDVRISFNRRRD